MPDAVSGTTGTTYVPGATTTVERKDQGSQKDMLLKLLVAQMKYQDPSNPASSNELMAQNATFTQVLDTDLSLFKSFPIREDWELQFRTELFNVFNIQNWDTPANANLTLNTNATTLSNNVGRISGLAVGTNPRQIQFGLRLMF